MRNTYVVKSKSALVVMMCKVIISINRLRVLYAILFSGNNGGVPSIVNVVVRGPKHPSIVSLMNKFSRCWE